MWFIGENPKHGIPIMRIYLLSVDAGNTSFTSWTPLEGIKEAENSYTVVTYPNVLGLKGFG